MHATIPKGNMRYDQFTVPDTVAVEPTLVTFLKHLETYVHSLPPAILSNFFEEQ